MPESNKNSFAYAILGYLLWIMCSALWFFVLLIARNTFMAVMSFFGAEYFSVRFLDKFIFLIAGILILGVVIVTEGYFRSGIEKKNLFYRFFRMSGAAVTMLFMGHFIISLISGFRFNDIMTYIVIGEFIFGSGFIFLSFHIKKIKSGEVKINGKKAAR